MKLVAVLSIAALALPALAGAQTTITFDETAAPCTFDQTSPLTTGYSGQGVTFNGSGSILDQCGNFGVNARSGTQFYAFAYSGNPVISFTSPINSFSIFGSSGDDDALFLATAYDQGGNVIGTTSVSTLAGQYGAIALNGPGIASVSITSTTDAYVFDDLSFSTTTTPEPSSMALLGTGLVGLVPMIRRKRRS